MAPCAVAFVFAVAASQLVGGPSKPAVTMHAQAIIWNNRVFVDKHQLAKWLRARGASYAAWAARHPRPTEAAAPAKPAATSRWHLLSAHKMLIGVVGVAVLLIALLAVLLRRTLLFLRDRELSRFSLPTRRRATPGLTPMGVLVYERPPDLPESVRLRRRLDVGFALAASSVGVGVALVLPHL
jgi:hypothetical protein